MKNTKYLILGIQIFLMLFIAGFSHASSNEDLAYGMKLEKSGDFNKAVAYYQSICKEKPSPQIYSRLVSLLGKLRKYDKALPVLDEALTKFPADVGLLNLQGLIAIRRQENDKAAKSWLKVLEIDPDNKFAKANLAKINVPVTDTQVAEDNVSESAKEAAGKVLGPEEQKKVAKGNLETIAQLEKSDTKAMINLYQDIVDRCPDTKYAPEACWRLANIFIISKHPSDYSSAAEFLEIILKRYPDEEIPSYLVRTRLINCYEQTREFTKASVHIRAIIDGYPEMPMKDKINFIFRYAEALNGAGQKESARTLYQQIVSEGEPHTSAVILARERLAN
jgi:tetratricopeptide (TPR) repeat protein